MCALKSFFHSAESVTRIIYALRIIPYEKSVQFEWKLAKLIGRIYFVRLTFLHLIGIVQNEEIFNIFFHRLFEAN